MSFVGAKMNVKVLKEYITRRREDMNFIYEW